MRKPIVCLMLSAAFLMGLAGCGGDLDSDLKKPADEVSKSAESLSVAELEARIKDVEARADAMGKKVGENPTEDQMKEMAKFVEVDGIYATELMKKKMK